MARDTPTLTVITPSSLHALSGEWFVGLEGTHFLPLQGATVVFSGPAGVISLYPNSSTDTNMQTWLPAEVLTHPGYYSVKVRVPDGATTLESNTVTLHVIGTSIFLRIPQYILVEANSPLGGIGQFDVSAESLASETVRVDCTSKSGDLFPFDRTSVDCTASDDTGDAVKDSFVVTVSDTTPPAIRVPSELTVFGKDDGSVVTYDATASDLVDGDTKPSCFPESGTFFKLGTASVQCSSSDRRGNKGSVAFRVHVGSDAFPALIVPSSVAGEASSADGAFVKFDATASDSKGNALDVKCEPAAGSFFPMGTTTVKCTAWGPSGNATTDAFDVKVGDTTGPELSLPRDFTEQAATPDGAIVKYPATAKDAVNGDLAVDCFPASGSLFAVGTTTVNCSSADKAGNKSSGKFVVTVLPAVDDTVYSTVTVSQ